MLIRDVITEFHFDCQVRKLSPRTIALYDRQLEYLAAYMENEASITMIEEVRSIHIKKFLVIKANAGRKPQYINDLLKAFKVFFKYCLQEGHIQSNPCSKVQNVKQPKVKIRTFNEEEIRKMLNYYSGRKFTDIRNKTMLAMFFDTGMRLNEVLSLKQEQIHDEYILVHGKGNKERLVPVSPYLAKLLLKYRIVKDSYFHVNTIPQSFVFVSYRGIQLKQQAVSNMIKEAANAVGVRKDIRVSPHTCRHTFAHLQLKNGLDPSFALVTRTIRKAQTEKPHIGYKEMEIYISTLADAKTQLATYEKVKKISHIQRSPYNYVRDWFLLTHMGWEWDNEKNKIVPGKDNAGNLNRILGLIENDAGMAAAA